MSHATIHLDARDFVPVEQQLLVHQDRDEHGIRFAYNGACGVQVWIGGTFAELDEMLLRIGDGILAARARDTARKAEQAAAIADSERAFADAADPHRPNVTVGPPAVDADPDGIAYGVAV